MRWYFVLLILGICLANCRGKPRIDATDKKILVKYPLNYSYFPKNFSSPAFSWHDLSEQTTQWELTFIFDGGSQKTFTSQSKTWNPTPEDWEIIKEKSQYKLVKLMIRGTDAAAGNALSRGEVFFLISMDSLETPILFRSVPLPFPRAPEQRMKIAWKLGKLADYTAPKTLMTGKRSCLNCHTTSLDGKTFGMEINVNDADKASYVTARITDEIRLFKKDVFSWNDSIASGKSISANHSAISPHGEYIVSAIRSNLFFIDYPESIEMVSYFQPDTGILGYKRLNDSQVLPLKGADDIGFSHTSPHWSHDGKTIAFARAPVKPNNLKASDPAELLKDSWRAHDAKRGYQFDIYTIDFNNGKGGTAMPLRGASHNGRSNFFPMYSPDGKWIVFTQAAAGFGIRPDCDLYIIPAKGGAARKLNSNGDNAESWHSWSPDSKWLAFVSKSHNAYTQLLITRIDSNGNDTPPVVVHRFAEDGMAVNMPIFLDSDKLSKIVTDFE